MFLVLEVFPTPAFSVPCPVAASAASIPALPYEGVPLLFVCSLLEREPGLTHHLK